MKSTMIKNNAERRRYERMSRLVFKIAECFDQMEGLRGGKVQPLNNTDAVDILDRLTEACANDSRRILATLELMWIASMSAYASERFKIPFLNLKDLER